MYLFDLRLQPCRVQSILDKVAESQGSESFRNSERYERSEKGTKNLDRHQHLIALERWTVQMESYKKDMVQKQVGLLDYFSWTHLNYKLVIGR
ncbi:hypothetical protein Pyn_07352 [Prunus yedoensis var. nudiflora]|uniref:Uncharacterized protein n=1 Tax=Prunus yedoensis var. nudiflora TaxID=2094558 RepID=A0A315AZ67_PRUYE|nr:hypothetical protein Pyn_07352 [Prunus yedoensis var. nudiflora]